MLDLTLLRSRQRPGSVVMINRNGIVDSWPQVSESPCCCSVTKWCPTLCNPHGLQHTRIPCLSLSPGICSDSCPLRWWCHPTISSCRPLLFPPSIFPNIRVFCNESTLHIRRPKCWSFSMSPWLIWSPCCPRDSSWVFSNTTVQKHPCSGTQPSLWYNSHIRTWLLEKP